MAQVQRQDPGWWLTREQQRVIHSLREEPSVLSPHTEKTERSINPETMSRMMTFGKRSLDRVIPECAEHSYHVERLHQGTGSELVNAHPMPIDGDVASAERPGERLSGFRCGT